MNPAEKIKSLFAKSNVTVDSRLDDRIISDALTAQKKSIGSAYSKPTTWRITLWSKVGYLAATFLIISSLSVSFVLFREVGSIRNELSQRDLAVVPTTDNSATINLYLKEHQDTIARYASLNAAASQPVQMRINQDDIMYYEFFDDGPEFMRPGIIVRGPSYQHQIGSPEAPAISNGHTLTLSEAKETTIFDLVAPPWLHPYYKLGEIRIIDGRDALQLIYTNGINSISLFEQSLYGQRGLSHHDFREYAVYNNQGEGGGTILAWRDDTLSYVLIGNIEISQLMDMAQSISARK